MRFSRIFSKSFDIIGSSDIGLYDKISVDGFPGFGIIITSANFHMLGVYFNLIAALMMLVSFIIPFFGSCLRISPVIKSKPGDFFGFKFSLISLVTSETVASVILLISFYAIACHILINLEYVWLESML